MKYATRINTYLTEGYSLEGCFDVISNDLGLKYVDLNYPEHFSKHGVEGMKELLNKYNLKLNAINMRFRDHYINGDLGNLDPSIKEDALKLSLEGVRACEDLNGDQIIFWLGHDGYDYNFQINYNKSWNQIVEIIKKACQSTDKEISIEYKPYEERVNAMVDSFGTAMFLINEVNEENFGMTADYCHILMKKESPAFVVSMLLERGLLYNIHLNDGRGNFDDGLMIGTSTFWMTLETFYHLKKHDFKGAVYFDTFPRREKAVEETRFNLRMCKYMEELIDNFGIENITEVVEKNDAVLASNMMLDIIQNKK